MSKDKISKHIFVPNEGYCVYYPSKLFFVTGAVLKIGKLSLGYSPGISLINISWIISNNILVLSGNK